jgi:hypothetical protein
VTTLALAEEPQPAATRQAKPTAADSACGRAAGLIAGFLLFTVNLLTVLLVTAWFQRRTAE